MGGIKAMFNDGQIKKQLFKFQAEQKSKMNDAFAYIGEEIVKDARERSASETYTDRTGNLRSSIGYVVKENNKTLTKKNDAHNGKGSQGVSEARDLMNEIKTKASISLTVVAGMEYAAPVEAMQGKSVLSGSIPTGKQIEKTIKELLG